MADYELNLCDCYAGASCAFAYCLLLNIRVKSVMSDKDTHILLEFMIIRIFLKMSLCLLLNTADGHSYN